MNVHESSIPGVGIQSQRLLSPRRFIGERSRRSLFNYAAILLPGQLLQQQIKVFQLRVFDDDFAASVVILDVHLESEGAL